MTRSSRAPPRPSSPLPGEDDATAGCDDADVRGDDRKESILEAMPSATMTSEDGQLR
jgi:hypothetical protein